MNAMSETSIAEPLQSYLEVTLHNPVRLKPLEQAPGLPAFLDRMYRLLEGPLAGRRCVFLATVGDTSTPADIAKHVALVRSAVDAVVVFVAPSLSAYNRSRLIGRGVPFVVPGRQLYIPDLAMDLRERFGARPQRSANRLSPAAQAVLFHRLLRLDSDATTPSLIAPRLRYSAMSIGRAFDDLVNAGLADAEKRGKERHIRFTDERRQLFDAAHDLLRSPVRAEKFVRGGHIDRNGHIDRDGNMVRDRGINAPLKHAGESALAQLTDLSPPLLNAFAVAAGDWKAVAKEREFVETDREDAARIVETWAYDPAGLSDARTVDPLSLYAQFREHRDERISLAADQLLRRVAW